VGIGVRLGWLPVEPDNGYYKKPKNVVEFVLVCYCFKDAVRRPTMF
jgi:hypothetical protein